MSTQTTNVGRDGERAEENIERAKEGTAEAGRKITEGVRELRAHGRDMARAGQQLIRESVEERIGRASQYSQDSLVEAKRHLQEKPFQSLAIAAGAGLLFGLYLGGRRRQQPGNS